MLLFISNLGHRVEDNDADTLNVSADLRRLGRAQHRSRSELSQRSAGPHHLAEAPRGWRKREGDGARCRALSRQTFLAPYTPS